MQEKMSNSEIKIISDDLESYHMSILIRHVNEN